MLCFLVFAGFVRAEVFVYGTVANASLIIFSHTKGRSVSICGSACYSRAVISVTSAAKATDCALQSVWKCFSFIRAFSRFSVHPVLCPHSVTLQSLYNCPCFRHEERASSPRPQTARHSISGSVFRLKGRFLFDVTCQRKKCWTFHDEVAHLCWNASHPSPSTFSRTWNSERVKSKWYALVCDSKMTVRMAETRRSVYTQPYAVLAAVLHWTLLHTPPVHTACSGISVEKNLLILKKKKPQRWSIPSTVGVVECDHDRAVKVVDKGKIYNGLGERKLWLWSEDQEEKHFVKEKIFWGRKWTVRSLQTLFSMFSNVTKQNWCRKVTLENWSHPEYFCRFESCVWMVVETFCLWFSSVGWTILSLKSTMIEHSASRKQKCLWTCVWCPRLFCV